MNQAIKLAPLPESAERNSERQSSRVSGARSGTRVGSDSDWTGEPRPKGGLLELHKQLIRYDLVFLSENVRMESLIFS